MGAVRNVVKASLAFPAVTLSLVVPNANRRRPDMALNIQSTNQQAAAKAIQKTIDGLNIPAADKAKLAAEVAKLAKSPDVIDKILRTGLAGSGATAGMLGETLVAAGIGASLYVAGKEILPEIG